MHLSVKVGTRTSRLALAQVEEVLKEIHNWDPEITFDLMPVLTTGDLDKTTSLRNLGATDFFTKELDTMLLEGKCDIAIHSAKDLPDPLHNDLEIIALTKGVDPRDALVMNAGVTLETLPHGAKVATSSLRRMEAITKLRSDLTLVDIRGTIDERLGKLFSHECDALVIAKAALIRLNLLHLNHLCLDAQPAPLQGRLAILARKSDPLMTALFHRLNV